MTSLLDRRLALARVTHIPDVAAHALEWAKLAADFRALDRLCNAALCDAQAEYFRSLLPGAYRVDERGAYQALVPEEA